LLRSAAAVSGVVALLGGALLMRYPRKVAMCATTESPAGTDAAPAEEDRRWSLLQQYKDHDVVFSVDILSENPAGFEVDFLGMGGFMPKSQTAPSTLSGSPVGKTVEVKLLELDIPTRFLVSQKAAGPPAKTLADIEEKALYEGTVTNVREFGVFVDLGGVEGLLHVSQISNERVDSVSAIFTRGDAVKCVVDSVDADRNRISLGTWQLEPERGDMKKDKQAVFEKAEATYAAFKERPAAASRQETSMEGLTEGELYEGKVVNVKDFGAFVDLGDGKPQGLLHISQISCLRVDSVYNVFQVGDTVKCMLLSKDTERNRIGLSTWQLEVEEGDMINDKEAVFAKAEETLAAYWEKEEEGGTWSDNE
jgi:ribosomal protein S1